MEVNEIIIKNIIFLTHKEHKRDVKDLLDRLKIQYEKELSDLKEDMETKGKNAMKHIEIIGMDNKTFTLRIKQLAVLEEENKKLTEVVVEQTTNLNLTQMELDKLKKEIRALGLLCEGKELSKNILKKELEDLRNDIHLAKQCVKFRGSICDNKDCKNTNCSVNEKESK